jgi:hypothetical protein
MVLDDLPDGAAEERHLKPGKRGRDAAGKSKVLVAVETAGNKPRSAAMRQIPGVRGDEIKAMAQACLAAEVVARTNGWQAYRVLNSEASFHIPIVTGSGTNVARLFPWVHTLIANVKGTIRGVYHGVSDQHLSRYLAEFCYRFNRRFWEPQMFNRMITACLNALTVTFSELRL